MLFVIGCLFVLQVLRSPVIPRLSRRAQVLTLKSNALVNTASTRLMLSTVVGRPVRSVNTLSRVVCKWP